MYRRSPAVALCFLLMPLGSVTLDAQGLPGASLRATAGSYEIVLPSIDFTPYLDSAGDLLLSVEVPRTVPAGNVMGFVQTPTGINVLEESSVSGSLPPGPDDGTWWISFVFHGASTSEAHEIRFQIETAASLSFTRILLGRPSTPYSRILGAFKEISHTSPMIYAGEDLLGTVEASQRVRFPADFIGYGIDAFDEMVAFGEAPFSPETDNVDTVMIRTMDIPVGGPSPVRLLRFQNKTVEPITVSSQSGPQQFEITARLSSNAVSGGFITIRPDGTYESTTSLYPVFEFQRIESGEPVGDPIVVDTAVQEVPGFPFYLASSGGRWTETAPAGRLVTPGSSNFFYDNGVSNLFIHSNGPSGNQASCLKANGSSNS